ncbi:hypothetical protein J2754_002219 [Halarchaeum solikamskense]|nr:hypothetical protein [Halarchaeum solikamskense]MBP2251882.1 hypothetical protein [Halarchaeum solikamskense]
MPRDFGYRDGVDVDPENTGMIRGGREIGERLIEAFLKPVGVDVGWN